MAPWLRPRSERCCFPSSHLPHLQRKPRAMSHSDRPALPSLGARGARHAASARHDRASTGIRQQRPGGADGGSSMATHEAWANGRDADRKPAFTAGASSSCFCSGPYHGAMQGIAKGAEGASFWTAGAARSSQRPARESDDRIHHPLSSCRLRCPDPSPGAPLLPRGRRSARLRAGRILVELEREAAMGVEAARIGGRDGVDGGGGGGEQILC